MVSGTSNMENPTPPEDEVVTPPAQKKTSKATKAEKPDDATDEGEASVDTSEVESVVEAEVEHPDFPSRDAMIKAQLGVRSV